MSDTRLLTNTECLRGVTMIDSRGVHSLRHNNLEIRTYKRERKLSRETVTRYMLRNSMSYFELSETRRKPKKTKENEDHIQKRRKRYFRVFLM
ncbi:hypothetical protein SISNIDRAFT_67797 [Sistotremastrum niveocremeum HHB9708]|uniref:Uncharacterized protein n=1 Tax=Sistotremastrum niveocremeum HHB9708 TaxID=1314777 RepID=A0A164V270_9AGAM|nr:hypothetical protein SISNIDRAFT_67797 [Sistotremastrum niveocremeum HHB9708]